MDKKIKELDDWLEKVDDKDLSDDEDPTLREYEYITLDTDFDLSFLTWYSNKSASSSSAEPSLINEFTRPNACWLALPDRSSLNASIWLCLSSNFMLPSILQERSCHPRNIKKSSMIVEAGCDQIDAAGIKSIKVFEKKLGYNSKFFSYPFGAVSYTHLTLPTKA